MSSPAQTSTVEAQPLVAVRNVRVRAAGMGACSEQTRFPITRTATCTIGSGAPADCYFSSTLGTRKTIPISSTPTRRLLGMASCCGSRSKISTPRSSALAGWARRLSKTLTSIPRPDTGRFGCAIWTGMWWCSPVRTVKAVPKMRLGLALDSPRFHQTPFVIASEREAIHRPLTLTMTWRAITVTRKFLLPAGFLLSRPLSSWTSPAPRAFHNATLRTGTTWLV
jgi:hypothetical protein